ncbi:MAG: hypothetical protein WC239_05200 [Sphaerochaetaceae bacterium]
MLRMRRLLAFCGRVHNYILVLSLFSLALFFTQLWWDVQPEFAHFMASSSNLLAELGLGYSLVMFILSLILSIVDRIIPWSEVFKTLLRSLFFGVTLILVIIFTDVTQSGLVLSL